jgi:prepilin-type N-terminal cleavage/methylation domain-containing protein
MKATLIPTSALQGSLRRRFRFSHRLPRSRAACHAFTLVEILVVVAIIGILAGLIVGLAGRASETKILSRARAERDMLVMAIENYKSKLGYYPQDHPKNPAMSPLYNELTRMRIPDAYTNETTGFGVPDIANIGAKSDNFLPGGLKPTQYKVLGTGGRGDEPGGQFTAAQMIYAYGNAPWQYNITNPTNNPGGFDLWVEIVVGPKKFVVGNWSE